MRKFLVLLLLLPCVFAFNEFTTIVVVGKAFPDAECPEKLYEGVKAIRTADFVLQHPEFAEYNLICDTNTYCKASVMATEWFQNAIKEEDKCKKAYSLGVASHLFILSKDPLNVAKFHENCRIEFYREVDNKIATAELNFWSVDNNCTTETGEQIKTTFTSEDLEKIALDLRTKWSETKPEIEVPAVQEDISGWLTQAVQAGKPATVPSEILNKLWDLSCLYTTERKLDLYSKWEQLSQVEKLCLGFFTDNPNGMNFIQFSECPAIWKDVYGSQYYQAFWILERYASLGFAEKQCTANPFGQQLAQGSTLYAQFCTYKPLQVTRGCIEEFQDKDIWEAGKWNEGFAVGMVSFALIAIVILFVKILVDTAG